MKVKNHQKKNNDKKNSISENINDDYYTFSDISSINPNNNDNTENNEKYICFFKDNNEIKNKNGKCCIFVNKSGKIEVENIVEKIKRNRKLKKVYLNRIIENKDNCPKNGRSKSKKGIKK